MKELFRPAVLICLVLLVPILPFFLVGEQRIEHFLSHYASSESSAWHVAAVLVGLLASDIILPVPSSVVNTLAGGRLGLIPGTLVCWMGMNAGAVIGFWLGRFGGQRVALWFSSQSELDRSRQIVARYGQLSLIIVRGVPVLAEASVLLAGLHGMDWKKFLPPVMLANLVLAFTYAALGELANQFGWFGLSIVVAIVLPILLLLLFRRTFESSPQS